MENTNPKIVWKTINGVECLYFEFKGIFKELEALNAIEIWKSQVEGKENFILVWQCLEMENYEAKARIAWQNSIKKFGKKISAIWLITDSVRIQAGAEIISFFTYFNIHTVSSMKELEGKIKNKAT